MARTVNPEEYAFRRKEILDAAQRLVFTKGYEQMSIRDIVDELRISSGAFHHYFDSREALLEAFIERIQKESEKPLLPIIYDPDLTAIQKLQGFFDTLDQMRIAHKAEVIRLARVWYTDDNAIVRLKVDEAVFKRRAPLIVEIVRQGIVEGAFTSTFPDKAGEVILSLLQGMGRTHAWLLLWLDREKDSMTNDQVEGGIAEIVATHAAYMDAIERVLGASSNCLARTKGEAVRVWVAAQRENDTS